MSKSLLCLLAVIPLSASAIASSVGAIESNNPCYMRTSSGRVVSLGQLCSGRQSAPAPRLSRPSAPSRSKATTNDYMVSEGKGGGNFYQVWSTSDNKKYTLKVWLRQEFAEGSPSIVPQSFRSSGDAVKYFDCHYGEYYEQQSCKELR
ncbi:hypothetical protein, partial [Leptolyngbya sp. FACHB-36]|uniref:hypothetical protein n=1 Tax=Leptolyngbya sp. FACHB-36 TaxID=2692808 RepID=UPI001680BD8A